MWVFPEKHSQQVTCRNIHRERGQAREREKGRDTETETGERKIPLRTNLCKYMSAGLKLSGQPADTDLGAISNLNSK
jgi:hypothetical protein